jgi:NAD(P)-dependent dehydrogenase (short-subunit alcohol dehydrogenase family)
MPDAELAGKNAIVTGASRGLGLAIAEALGRAGANLLLVARSSEALVETRRQALAAGAPEAHIFPADLEHDSAPEAILAEARRVWPRLDILVNNAAIVGPIGKLWENDWDQWRCTIAVNLLAPVALCRLAVPWMVQTGGGTIINLSGGGATKARPHFSAYGTAKAALVRFSETLAEEAAAHHIRVNCVAPGAMNTAMLAAVLHSSPEAAGAEYAQAQKQAREGGAAPELAAELCVFLASGRSAGITGKLISAVWDPWRKLTAHAGDLRNSDIYTLRRIVPADRGKNWHE